MYWVGVLFATFSNKSLLALAVYWLNNAIKYEDAYFKLTYTME